MRYCLLIAFFVLSVNVGASFFIAVENSTINPEEANN